MPYIYSRTLRKRQGNVFFIQFQRVRISHEHSGAFSCVEVASWSKSSRLAESTGAALHFLELRDGKTLVALPLSTGCPTKFHIRYSLYRARPRLPIEQCHAAPLRADRRRVAQENPFAVIRIEISSVKRESLGENALENASFCQIGHIAAYYGENDDFFFYIKAIFRNPPTSSKSPNPLRMSCPRPFLSRVPYT